MGEMVGIIGGRIKIFSWIVAVVIVIAGFAHYVNNFEYNSEIAGSGLWMAIVGGVCFLIIGCFVGTIVEGIGDLIDSNNRLADLTKKNNEIMQKMALDISESNMLLKQMVGVKNDDEECRDSNRDA